MALFSRKYVISFRGIEGHELKAVAARYTKSANPAAEGKILILTHAVGAHKEQWLPVLECLYSQPELNIGETWSLDGANHGDSLAYNKKILETDLEAICDLSAYGQAVLGLLDSGLIDSRGREIIAIGHSAGCQAIVHSSAAYFRQGRSVPFSTIILLEPVFLPEGVSTPMLTRISKPAGARKWQWNSRDEAFQYFSATFPWKRWNKDVLELYIEYGMVHTISGSHLKVPAYVEAGCYPNTRAQMDGLRNFPVLCKKASVHIIFGAQLDFIPQKFRDGFVASAKDRVASLQFIKNAGHMLVQETPDGCTETIRNVLHGGISNSAEQSRL